MNYLQKWIDSRETISVFLCLQTVDRIFCLWKHTYIPKYPNTDTAMPNIPNPAEAEKRHNGAPSSVFARTCGSLIKPAFAIPPGKYPNMISATSHNVLPISPISNNAHVEKFFKTIFLSCKLIIGDRVSVRS